MSTGNPYNAGYNQGPTTYHSWPPGYQQHAGAKVYGSTPVVTKRPPPTNWLCPAIFSFLCFFLPLGLVAIFYAWEANQRVERHDLRGAEQSASCAKTLTLTSVFIGVVTVGAILALYFTGVLTVQQKINHLP
ncbi:synapse differentiation-inducing gene protein 1-like isoform X2 [Saccostrea echinata]|uniref:synapse differentiation-inducing gene protein 1-like isoform X2 n=1 Tax=Saccostrea echinata TaxID=191078 RepID=UPI002A824C5F|nr:synapse differentiation-inducing gene protein 1-like isoform X2 [Saccostrea echinata]